MQATSLTAIDDYGDDVQTCGGGCDLIYPIGMLDRWGCCAACIADADRTENEQNVWAASMDARDYLGDDENT